MDGGEGAEQQSEIVSGAALPPPGRAALGNRLPSLNFSFLAGQLELIPFSLFPQEQTA